MGNAPGRHGQGCHGQGGNVVVGLGGIGQARGRAFLLDWTEEACRHPILEKSAIYEPLDIGLRRGKERWCLLTVKYSYVLALGASTCGQLHARVASYIHVWPATCTRGQLHAHAYARVASDMHMHMHMHVCQVTCKSHTTLQAPW